MTEEFFQLHKDIQTVIKGNSIVECNTGIWGGYRNKKKNGYYHRAIDNTTINTSKLEEIISVDNQYYDYIKFLKDISDKDTTIRYKHIKSYSTFNDLICENSILHMIECSQYFDNDNIKIALYSKNDFIEKESIISSISKLNNIIQDKNGAHKNASAYDMVILDNESAGLINAMLIGYFFEGDRICAGTSYLFNHLDKYVENPLINISDKLDSSFPVDFMYDEEGTKPKKDVSLIKQGKIQNMITDKLSADELKTLNTGRLRSQDYRYIPLPRITNIVTKSEDISENGFLNQIESGIYCVGVAGAAVDVASGIIHVNFTIGYKINNGEITYPIDNISLSIEVFDYIKKIRLVGGKAETHMRFMGKGRPLQNNVIGFSSPCIALEGCIVNENTK